MQHIFGIKINALQEVSDMLGGRISNQDEDEVEDELDALEAEITGVPMPNVPTSELTTEEREKRGKDRAEVRQAQKEEQRVAMLA